MQARRYAIRTRRRRAWVPEGARRRGLPTGNGRSSRRSTTAVAARTRPGATGWERGVGRRTGRDGSLQVVPEERRTEPDCRRRLAVVGAIRRGWVGRKDHGIRKEAAEAGHKGVAHTKVAHKGSAMGVVGCKGPGRGIRRSGPVEEGLSHSLNIWSAFVRKENNCKEMHGRSKACMSTDLGRTAAAGLIQRHDPYPWSRDPQTQRRAS